MSHANARLTPAGRMILVSRIAAGRPVAHVAAEMGISRTCGWRWWRRFQCEGVAGLHDRSSVAHMHPRRTAACVETRVRIHRHLNGRGAVWIARRVGLAPSTVGRVLVRHQVPLLRDVDPVTGEVIRARRRSTNRYEHPYPGSLIHIDVKKLGRIPDGGGWRGRGESLTNHASRPDKNTKVGYDYVHAAIDDHSRLAYAEIHPDEKGVTAAGFTARAIAFYADHGIRIQRVITDNAWCYRHSNAFTSLLAERGIAQKFIRPHCPWTNGKIERFNRTLAREWAYTQPWTDNSQRTNALTVFLDHYNLERPHLGIAGLTPINRVTNATGQYN